MYGSQLTVLVPQSAAIYCPVCVVQPVRVVPVAGAVPVSVAAAAPQPHQTCTAAPKAVVVAPQPSSPQVAANARGEEPLRAAPSSGPAPPRYTGTVKSFNEVTGYGFLQCEQTFSMYGRDVFLHKAQAAGLRIGQWVEFSTEVNELGHPQARNLAPMELDTDTASVRTRGGTEKVRVNRWKVHFLDCPGRLLPAGPAAPGEDDMPDLDSCPGTPPG
eukprot:TRINITY_DN15333_c0_g1_i1.p2 TRINITY_DN15333_c0_g1~~TRINITY_DN15333_c0_g1_i1.p2  ORF type:complete len:246 (+),score=17.43 TRINITY_DN15333_c0_g1_i1:91-738(+)